MLRRRKCADGDMVTLGLHPRAICLALAAWLCGLLFAKALENEIRCDSGLLSLQRLSGDERAGRRTSRRRLENQKRAGYVMPETDLVLYGDSIIEDLEGMDEALGVYREALRTTAFGISGDESGQLLYRIQQGELPQGSSPQFAVIMIGVNDIIHAVEDMDSKNKRQGGSEVTYVPARKRKKLASNIETNVIQMAAYIQRKSCRTQVIVMAILPMAWKMENKLPNRFTASIEEANARLSSAVAEYDNVHFADCSAVFLQESETRIARDLMDDLLHPTEKGHRMLASCVLSHARQAAKEVLARGVRKEFSPWWGCSKPCGGGIERRRQLGCEVESDFLSGMGKASMWDFSEELCGGDPERSDIIRICNLQPCQTNLSMTPTPPPDGEEPLELPNQPSSANETVLDGRNSSSIPGNQTSKGSEANSTVAADDIQPPVLAFSDMQTQQMLLPSPEPTEVQQGIQSTLGGQDISEDTQGAAAGLLAVQPLGMNDASSAELKAPSADGGPAADDAKHSAGSIRESQSRRTLVIAGAACASVFIVSCLVGSAALLYMRAFRLPAEKCGLDREKFGESDGSSASSCSADLGAGVAPGDLVLPPAVHMATPTHQLSGIQPLLASASSALRNIRHSGSRSRSMLASATCRLGKSQQSLEGVHVSRAGIEQSRAGPQLNPLSNPSYGNPLFVATTYSNPLFVTTSPEAGWPQELQPHCHPSMPSPAGSLIATSQAQDLIHDEMPGPY